MNNRGRPNQQEKESSPVNPEALLEDITQYSETVIPILFLVYIHTFSRYINEICETIYQCGALDELGWVT